MLVAETAALLAASLPSHVKLTISQGVETATVSGEPEQLQQVILNLCNNAAQALEQPGFVDLRIAEREVIHPLRIGRTDLGSGRFVVISVSDPGPGMDDATLNKFSSRFSRRVSMAPVLGRQRSARSSNSMAAQSPCRARRVRGPASTYGCRPTVHVNRYRCSRRRLSRFGAPARRSWCSRPIAGACCVTEGILAALGYEPVGFTALAEAEAACRSARARFDAALVCHLPGGSALDLAAALHRAAPGLPIILASPSTHDLAAHLLAASEITGMVHHPLMSSELAMTLARCSRRRRRPRDCGRSRLLANAIYRLAIAPFHR